MKKTRRLLCMSLAVVMLLGAIPAYAATPMTAAASLIALPLSGKLFTALPVSDNISKALTVKEIESTYSTEAKSAPTSAPVEQTTFATTANPAPANHLPDGTTGATVGVNGDTTGNINKLTDPRFNPNPYNKKFLYDVKGKPVVVYGCYNASRPVGLFVENTKCTPADLVGCTIPANIVADVFLYDSSTSNCTFLCQYDTRGTGDLLIEQVPSVWAAKQPRKAPAPARTSFNDVKSGDWYYEAVTALAQNGVIRTVFDTDPSGNFNPNALVKDSEIKFIQMRLFGNETQGVVMDTSLDKIEKNPTDEVLAIKTQSTKWNAMGFVCGMRSHMTNKPAAPAQTDTSQEDRDALARFVETVVATKKNRSYWGYSDDGIRVSVPEAFSKHDALNIVRTPGTPTAIDFDARVTRAEFCVMLYRAGLTSFGCCAPKK